MTDVSSTIGAAMAGGMISIALSALVGFQTFLYFLVFPSDRTVYRFMVGFIWLGDLTHTVLICVSVWCYAIVNYNNPDIQSHIFRTIPAIVAMNGLITFSVNAFYIFRIYKLSKKNWWIVGPVVLLSIGRLGLGLATAGEMLRTGNFHEFKDKFNILFTTGLIVSAITDIFVSFERYYYLRDLKQGYATSREMVDATVVFTINDGLLTCAVAVACIIFWLTMTHNFVYLAVYFTIAKLYANSFLATLNLRNWYRHRFNMARPSDIIVRRSGGIPGVHVAVERERSGNTSVSSPRYKHHIESGPEILEMHTADITLNQHTVAFDSRESDFTDVDGRDTSTKSPTLA